MCLSGWAAASRRTRLSSVPMAHELPGCGGVERLDDVLGRADQVGRQDDLVLALRVHDHGDVRDGCAHVGRRCAPRTGRAPSSARATGSSGRRAAAAVVRPPPGLRGSNTTQSSSESPSCCTAVLRPRCWSGMKSTLPVPPTPPTLSKAHRRATCAFDDVQMVPPWRPVNALIDAGGVHVGDGTVRVGDAGVDEHVPRVLDLVDRRHVRHRAARGEVREDHLLVVGREDVRRLRHEVHAAEEDELGLGPGGGLARELERVARDVGELDDLVALVVVAEHEGPAAQRGAGRAGALDEVRVARGGQVADALDAALGGQVDTASQQEEGRRGRLGEGAHAHAAILAHGPARSRPTRRATMHGVRVLIAPDSFGSSLTAAEAAQAMAGAWRATAPHDEVTHVPAVRRRPGLRRDPARGAGRRAGPGHRDVAGRRAGARPCSCSSGRPPTSSRRRPSASPLVPAELRDPTRTSSRGRRRAARRGGDGGRPARGRRPGRLGDERRRRRRARRPGARARSRRAARPARRRWRVAGAVAAGRPRRPAGAARPAARRRARRRDRRRRAAAGPARRQRGLRAAEGRDARAGAGPRARARALRARRDRRARRRAAPGPARRSRAPPRARRG